MKVRRMKNAPRRARSYSINIPPCAGAIAISNVEAEVHYISILHQVFLALNAQPAFILSTLLTSKGDVVIVAYYFSLDKALLKIGMDHASCLRCLPTSVDGPCTY